MVVWRVVTDCSSAVPKAVWNSMCRKKHIQVRKLHEKQGKKSTAKQTSAEVMIAVLWAHLWKTYQSNDSYLNKEEEMFKEPVWEGTEGFLQSLASQYKHKEPD